MTAASERRTDTRLVLSYPIEIRKGEESGPSIGRTVTQNLSARGAYFSTFASAAFPVGQDVAIVLTVPHRLATSGQEILLDMRGTARVVRVEGPELHRRYGEDGATLSGVAIEFSNPLTFRYRWVG